MNSVTVGRRETFEAGDSFLLYRTRENPRGIIGYGKLGRIGKEEDHWRDEGKQCRYVKMRPERLITRA